MVASRQDYLKALDKVSKEIEAMSEEEFQEKLEEHKNGSIALMLMELWRKRRKMMKTIFSYICKKCWHGWKSNIKKTKCPKCGSENIDEEQDINWEG